MNQPSKTRAYLSLLLTFILWGSLYVASQIVMQELSTFTVACLRFILAWLFLTLLIHFKKGTVKEPFRPDAACKKYIWFLGFFGYTIAVGLQLMGTKLAGSTTASLINSTNPIVITLLAALILKEPLTKNKVIGIFLAVFGVYMIIGSDIQINPLGLMLSIVAVLGWALTSVLTRSALSSYPPLQVTRHAIGVAAICNIPICLAEIILTGGPETISLPTVLCLLYMGFCCTGVAYILWNSSLAALPASTCSSFYPIQPLTSAVLGILVFHETITTSFIVGALFIVCGIFTSLFKRKVAQPVG